VSEWLIRTRCSKEWGLGSTVPERRQGSVRLIRVARRRFHRIFLFYFEKTAFQIEANDSPWFQVQGIETGLTWFCKSRVVAIGTFTACTYNTPAINVPCIFRTKNAGSRTSFGRHTTVMCEQASFDRDA